MLWGYSGYICVFGVLYCSYTFWVRHSWEAWDIFSNGGTPFIPLHILYFKGVGEPAWSAKALPWGSRKMFFCMLTWKDFVSTHFLYARLSESQPGKQQACKAAGLSCITFTSRQDAIGRVDRQSKAQRGKGKAGLIGKAAFIRQHKTQKHMSRQKRIIATSRNLQQQGKERSSCQTLKPHTKKINKKEMQCMPPLDMSILM